MYVEPGAISTPFVQNADTKSIQSLDEDFKPKADAFMKYISTAFDPKSGITQTPEEVAAYVKQAAEDETPNLRYVTNAKYGPLLNGKYSDLTGNNTVSYHSKNFN